ncbi:hypothetical protein DV113_004135 [Geotrichum candidum]|nr:hypothetical protein DV452_001504 [Geotrichum candidum]KAF7497822.1 hypothetical protein DV113_004135 [Geotrichum candidum]KAI8131278.1 hypothetical protein DUD61_005063 [Geotrichum candidum]KAI9210995.1 hypothetical protein DS838_004124 [Geotrichum bryndzae]
MALKTAPVLPRIEDSSFDQLAFSNYIMNEADIGLNPAATQRAPTTPPPKPEFSFAEPDAAAPYGAPSTSGASLAASLEMSKTYRVFTDSEYAEMVNTKQLLQTRLANLEAELERTIARKVELATVVPATKPAMNKETSHRRSIFSSKRKSKVIASSTAPGTSNSSSSSIDSPEIAAVNEKIVTLNQQITELTCGIKDYEVQLLQHQAGVLAAGGQMHQDSPRRQQTPTAKATARMKGFSQQQQQQQQQQPQQTNIPQNADYMSLIDGLIIGLGDCLDQISVDGVPTGADGKRLSPRSQAVGPDGKTPESSQTSLRSNDRSNSTSTAATGSTAAAIAGRVSSQDTVASKLQTLAAVGQQLTAQVGRLQARAASAETALEAAVQAKTQLQRQHLQEIEQLKRKQLAEIERLQADLATLETAATPLSVNILQREFKNMMREKLAQAERRP